MATKKRGFIAFAAEDKTYRDFLVGQARNSATPFDFIDMSVKQPWDTQWKTNCCTKIRGCDGMIALVSKNSQSASGQLWEVKCAKEEGVRVRGVYVQADDKPTWLPSEFDGVRIVYWTWDNIANFLDSL